MEYACNVIAFVMSPQRLRAYDSDLVENVQLYRSIVGAL